MSLRAIGERLQRQKWTKFAIPAVAVAAVSGAAYEEPVLATPVGIALTAILVWQNYRRKDDGG